MTQRSVDRTTLLGLIAQSFNSPQARVALMSTTACPALTRLSGNMPFHAPYAYGAWLKASKVTRLISVTCFIVSWVYP